MAKNILASIDLTTLSGNESIGDIAVLCRDSVTPFGHVAAVCIYPQFLQYAKAELAGKPVKLATVVNFPSGEEPIDTVIREIQRSIANGADEIDVVWPYKTFLAGDSKTPADFIRQCKEACGKQVLLKVILETGAFPNADKIYEASLLLIDNGADFLKTSTGKIKVGATKEAAIAMMVAISESGKKIGFKASGGVRTVEQAVDYLLLTENILDKSWISPNLFRIGASSLLNDVIKYLS